MRVVTSSKFSEKFPNHRFGLGIIRNCQVLGPNDETEEILRSVYPKVERKFSGIKLEELPQSKAYIKATGVLGGRRFGFPYDQIARVLQGKSISNVNNVVNQYMVYELLSNLSFSAYDLDTFEGDILIDLAGSGEKIVRIGGERKTIPVGDIVFRDKNDICYSFSVGYAEKTKVISATKNVLYVIDGPLGIDEKEIELNMKNLCKEFGSNEYYILNSLTKDVVI